MLFLTGLIIEGDWSWLQQNQGDLALSSRPGIPSDEGGRGRVDASLFLVPEGIWNTATHLWKISAYNRHGNITVSM